MTPEAKLILIHLRQSAVIKFIVAEGYGHAYYIDGYLHVKTSRTGQCLPEGTISFNKAIEQIAASGPKVDYGDLFKKSVQDLFL